MQYIAYVSSNEIINSILTSRIKYVLNFYRLQDACEERVGIADDSRGGRSKVVRPSRRTQMISDRESSRSSARYERKSRLRRIKFQEIPKGLTES